MSRAVLIKFPLQVAGQFPGQAPNRRETHSDPTGEQRAVRGPSSLEARQEAKETYFRGAGNSTLTQAHIPKD